jgi:carnitine O-acetyltransferase
LLTIDPIVNRKSLSAIEDALFVLCLDDGSTDPPSSLGKAALYGHPSRGQGHNRWFDKAISFIVENNGRASVMGEHSPVDGIAVDYFLHFVLKVSVVQAAAGKTIDSPWLTSAKAPQITSPSVHHLTWTTDLDVDGFLNHAQASANATAKKVLFHNLLFDDFGNDAMRKAVKLPLDSLYHMIMQLTFYRLYGTITPTYETAQTQMFRNGRTETIRVCSVESKRFVEAFDDPHIPKKVKRKIMHFELREMTPEFTPHRKRLSYWSRAPWSIKNTQC